MDSKLGVIITAGSVIVPMVASWMIYSMMLGISLRLTQVRQSQSSYNYKALNPIKGPPRPPRITTTTTTTTSTTTTTTTSTTTTFQPVVQPTDAPATNPPVNQPANQVTSSSPSTTSAITTTTASPTTADSTNPPAPVSGHHHIGLNIFLLLLVLFLRK